MILHLFPLIFWSTLITLILTPVGIRLALHYHFVDEPFSAPHKTHQNPMPKVGGIVIALVVAAMNLLSGSLFTPEVHAILLPCAIIVLFGLWDDMRGLAAHWKLAGQVLATAILIWQGTYIHMFGQPVTNYAMTFLWVVGITNAFNFVDSMDGLAIGLAALASAFFMLVTVDTAQVSLVYLSSILLGASVGMLYFNAMPARTFLGDSGAQFLGFTLSALAIAYTPPGRPQPSSWFVPILLLSVPIFDATLVVISRLRRKVPIYQAGQDHTYHRLVHLGMHPSRAVITMHLASILTACLAFMALELPPLGANAIFALVVLCGLVALVWLEQKDTALQENSDL